ncbi:MAG: hypothetical protein GYA14_00790, partial [Ignavibacteria bacterium]|nr:hypothetical protein [Ignavibacteria bacterium]
MNKTSEFQNIKEWYLKNFKSFEEKLNGDSKTFLHDLRKGAINQLAETDFPSTKEEEWKFTNISPILKQSFIPAVSLGKKNYSLSKEEIKKHLFSGFDYYLMTFINGIFAEKLSDLNGLPKGV